MNINEDDKKFRIALYGSVLVHALFTLAFFFGMPSFFQKIPDEQQVITFEMLPASAISNVPTKAAKKKAKKTEKKPEKAQKVKQSKQQIKQTTPEKTEEKTEKRPVPPAKTKKADVKAKAKQKAPDKKAAPVKPKRKKKPTASKKPKAQAKKKVQEDPLDSLLKNIEDASDGEKAKSPMRVKRNNDFVDSSFSRGAIYNENSPLSITERMLIKQQIEKNWRPPTGAKNVENVEVLFHLKLNKDGTIKEYWVLRTNCPNGSEETCKLVTNSAVRALKKAEPFENLYPERYDSWKEFDLNFDPIHNSF